MPPGAIREEPGPEDCPKATLSSAQRWKNVHFALEVLYALGIGRKPRERFEAGLAFRAAPEMANNLPIQVLRALRCNQFVAALDTINSEEGAWIDRHRIPQALFQSDRTCNRQARRICDARRCNDSLCRESLVRASVPL